MWPKRHRSRGRVTWRLLLATILVIGAVLVFTQRQAIADHISVWQYTPSSEIVALADRTNMSDHGRFLFFASQPELLGSERFNDTCAGRDPEGATLGCYRGGLIYIYDIDDERLDGIREVTAAHEMLHAAYSRFSDKEREEVNQLVDQVYDELQAEKLINRVELYERNQPGTRHLELHAIIGTEFRDIGPELEAHYDRYFTDRSSVVSLHESYESQFADREKLANEIKQRLDSIGDMVESESARYSRDVQVLGADIRDFNARAGSAQSGREHAQLVAERESLIARTSELESRRAEIDSAISEYNALVREYNSIVTEVRDLTDSLDSTLEPAPSV